MAHVILTVSRFEVAREFYRKLLPEFGMTVVHDGDKLFYCVGARTAIGIEPCDPALAGERFVQQRVGLHHLCLRARSRKDVDRCAALLKEMNATIVRGPMEGTWAPGYYYVLFEDPDGIRLEVNFVPGAGCSRTVLSSTRRRATSSATVHHANYISHCIVAGDENGFVASATNMTRAFNSLAPLLETSIGVSGMFPGID